MVHIFSITYCAYCFFSLIGVYNIFTFKKHGKEKNHNLYSYKGRKKIITIYTVISVKKKIFAR